MNIGYERKRRDKIVQKFFDLSDGRMVLVNINWIKRISSHYAGWGEKAMAPHSSTVARKIPWMEEPGRLQSMGSLTVRHDWATSLSLFNFHALEKEMATNFSVLAWRIPGTGEPGGLPSMGSHRVGHDWSDLAAAAAAGIPKVPITQLNLITEATKR